MSLAERDRVAMMLRWCVENRKIINVRERRKEYVTKYRSYLMRNADTFEALVIRTLLV